MPYVLKSPTSSAVVADCVFPPVLPPASSRSRYAISQMFNVPVGISLPFTSEPVSSELSNRSAAFTTSTSYCSNSSLNTNVMGALYSPYTSGHALQNASAETVLTAAARLPTITPDIPPLWNDNFEPLRSVYIEGVPPETSNAEILQLISAGALERMRRFVQRKCVILIFLRHEAALRFYAEFFMNAYELRGQPLNIGWVPTPPMAPEIRYAVETQNASRNVYIEQHSGPVLGLAEREAELRKDLGAFGTIESVYSLSHRNITFVYYTNIASAVSAVNSLRQRSEAGESKWQKFTVAYGKDPCQSLLKLKKQAALLYLSRSPYDTTTLLEYDQATINKAIAYQSMAAVLTAAISGGDANIGNRCIYIGNCSRSTKLVDICNTVRGGMIENIRFFPERGICFVTFLEPCAAAQFYATYRLHRLLINGKPVKVGWGKHPGTLNPEMERAISRGVTRNVCIKDARPENQVQVPLATKEEIAEKFATFGPIEQIKMSPELGCIFITFTCIFRTMQAVEWAKATKVIPNSHIQYGKDRCATFPRFLSRRGSRGTERGSENERTDSPRDPVLIQYLRQEVLSKQTPFYIHQQLQPLTFLAPTSVTAPPMYYSSGTLSTRGASAPRQKSKNVVAGSASTLAENERCSSPGRSSSESD